MQTLINKHIIVGITGGIAAYKAAELVRGLVKSGAQVKVIMTTAAQEFIGPLTLQALSGQPVHTELLDENAEAAMGHIQLARWADLLIIAPASANTLSKIATGSSEDLLTAVVLATPAPIAMAPAMNQEMWHQQATQDNIERLHQRGFLIWGPASGEQACGDVGLGRMLEPADLVELAESMFETGLLAGKKVLITAGPTREAIDPVRYISNHSSGKMGYALAQSALEAGAEVILISGPTSLRAPTDCKKIDVESAADMYRESLALASQSDIFIAAAAVADFTPIRVANDKIKKDRDQIMSIELSKTADIVASVAKLNPKPFVVGFAAETQALLVNAQAKLEQKHLDLMIANDVSDKSIGFNSADNAVTLLWPDATREVLDKRSKIQLARDLIARIALKIH